MLWQVAIHMAFVLSAIGIAVIDKLMGHAVIDEKH